MAREQGSAGDEDSLSVQRRKERWMRPLTCEDMEVVGWDGGAEGQAGPCPDEPSRPAVRKRSLMQSFRLEIASKLSSRLLAGVVRMSYRSGQTKDDELPDDDAGGIFALYCLSRSVPCAPSVCFTASI